MTTPLVETNPSDFADYAALHRLLSTGFAYMSGRIDPPSSVDRMTPADLHDMASTHDLFLALVAGAPVGCLFGVAEGADYYVSKLAVSPECRGRGLARRLFAAAQDLAAARRLARLTLQTRVELVENHAIFARLGFAQIGTSSHPGHARPTSITMARPVPRAATSTR